MDQAGRALGQYRVFGTLSGCICTFVSITGVRGALWGEIVSWPFPDSYAVGEAWRKIAFPEHWLSVEHAAGLERLLLQLQL